MEVKINSETPTEAVLKAANATIITVDIGGRRITIRRLKSLDRLRLFELVLRGKFRK